MSAKAWNPVPYYCEENVWQLCDDPRVRGLPRAALVISNSTRSVAVAHQRAAPEPDAPIVWDYHVVLAAHGPRPPSVEHPAKPGPPGWMIWDPDCTLGMPLPLAVYLRASLGYPEGYPEPYAARFRVIEAELYRRTLATDRSHMLDEHGRYRAPPPPWPPIGEGTNLMRLVDLDDPFVGQIVELAGLPAALRRIEQSP